MKLHVENTSTRVLDATQDELDWLREFLAFPNVKAEQRQRMGIGQHGQDTHIRLFNTRGRSFPSGLLPIVTEHAATGVDLVDHRAAGERNQVDFTADPWRMRDAWGFQSVAVAAAFSGKAGLDGRGIIKAPTGSGKGNIAVALAAAAPGRWLFVVHRGHLAQDVRERWSKLAPDDVPAGYIGDGEWSVSSRLTCCTLQTLHAALKRGDPRFTELTRHTTGLIVDECHTAPARSYYATIQAFTEARYRFGLSGTPLDRGDQRSLMAIASIGPMVYSIKARTLIDAGVLAEPNIRVLPVWQRASERAQGDWGRIYEELVVASTHRNAVVTAAMQAALKRDETPGMVFVRRVEHGLWITAAAEKLGLNVRFVDGSKSTAQRRKAIADLESGHLDFVVATKVFVEGVNVPELRCVINAAGGKSVIESLQQVGRGTRTTASKQAFTVYEIGDKGEGVLHNHTHERIRAYRREGYRVEVDRDVHPERRQV